MIRAYYYRVRGRSELDLHHVGPDGQVTHVESIVVDSKRDARRISAERGAKDWNF